MPTNTLFMTGLLCVWYAISATANPRYRNQWVRSLISSRALRPPPPGYGSGLPPPIRSTGRPVAPPASPRIPGHRRSEPKERGRSEVKRSRAGSPHGEPRTEPPSEAAERDLRLRRGGGGGGPRGAPAARGGGARGAGG